MFKHILNWKLLSGSHEFPGPDGGTCITEAAIVAAGFEYQEVLDASDCPSCFSRVISAYAICLNDRMPDHFRQELLLPFVTRLAGTADTPEVEKARRGLILMRTKRDILPPVAVADVYAIDAAAAAETKTLTFTAAAAAVVESYAYAAADAAAAKRVWMVAMSILDEAICLGRQAEPVETALVVERMERAKVGDAHKVLA